MREEEIKRELELGIRAFLEVEERSKAEAIDDFEEKRILESAFNRLFLSVEHLCNALVLFETGNFSPKHFGDLKKLQELKEKYKTDFRGVYEETYTFRGYGDYRKFPEIEEKFNRKHLQEEFLKVKKILEKILDILSQKIEIGYLIEKKEREGKQEKKRKELARF